MFSGTTRSSWGGIFDTDIAGSQEVHPPISTTAPGSLPVGSTPPFLGLWVWIYTRSTTCGGGGAAEGAEGCARPRTGNLTSWRSDSRRTRSFGCRSNITATTPSTTSKPEPKSPWMKLTRGNAVSDEPYAYECALTALHRLHTSASASARSPAANQHCFATAHYADG